MYSIRKFQPSDFERVIGIEKEAFNEYNPILFMAAYETFPEGFLVAEKDGDVVGFLTTIAVSIFDVKILSLAIDRRFQNKGFASMLMQQSLRSFANERGSKNTPRSEAEQLYRSEIISIARL